MLCLYIHGIMLVRQLPSHLAALVHPVVQVFRVQAVARAVVYLAVRRVLVYLAPVHHRVAVQLVAARVAAVVLVHQYLVAVVRQAVSVVVPVALVEVRQVQVQRG